jgi:hypothetical protein
VFRSKKLGRSRVRGALLVAVLSIGTAALLAAPAGATAPTYQDPPATNVSITTSATDGLVDGSTVTFTVHANNGAHLSGNIIAHLCAHTPAATTYSNTTFNYQGSTANRCIYSTGIDTLFSPGLNPSTGPNAVNYEFTSPTSYNPSTDIDSGPLTVHVGSGSLQWVNSTNDGPFPLTVDSSATPTLDLVIQADVAGGTAANGRTWIKQPLTFAGKPGAPTGVTATAGDNTAHVSWTAPGNTGNGTVNHYHVVATPTVGSPVLADTANGTTTAIDLPLANFSTYSIAVTTVTNELPGTPSDPGTVSPVNPLPPAPTGVIGTGGDQNVTVSWTAPGGSSTPTGYQVVAKDALGAQTDVTNCTNSTSTSYQFTGLTNSNPYTFKVQAYYGSTTNCADTSKLGPFSGPSNNVVPSNFEIDQQITVSRPAGALVLSQACDTTYPRTAPGGTTRDTNYPGPSDPYPQDPTTGLTPNGDVLYPTPTSVAQGSCSVNMGAAKLITGSNANPVNPGAGFPSVTEGAFFKATGTLHQVTIVNTRYGQDAFTINGKVSNFTDGQGHTLSGTALGWQPAVTDKTAPFQTPGQPLYTNDTTKGGDVLPASTVSDTGLTSGSDVLASAVHGLGMAHLDAQLHVLIPVTTKDGTYSALLQITAI